MKKTPQILSDIVSQSPFAEEVQVGKKQGKWWYITTSDSYQGWTISSHIIERKDPYISNAKTAQLFNHIYTEKSVCKEPYMTLPYGCPIFIRETEEERWFSLHLPNKDTAYIQKGNVCISPIKKTKKEIPSWCKKFLHIPYTWGGRSSFGFDCSAFVQMLYQEMEIVLPRDAHLQKKDPRFQEIEEKNLQPMDLIFFGTSSQEINHVGAYLEDHKFIHATVESHQPWIQINDLREEKWKEGYATRPYRCFQTLSSI